jgi:hypothetical protein
MHADTGYVTALSCIRCCFEESFNVQTDEVIRVWLYWVSGGF